MIISSASPVIPALAPGRYRISRQLSDGRIGTLCLIAGARTLIDLAVRELDGTDFVVTHSGGSVLLHTSPHIPGRRPPSVTLNLEPA